MPGYSTCLVIHTVGCELFRKKELLTSQKTTTTQQKLLHPLPSKQLWWQGLCPSPSSFSSPVQSFGSGSNSQKTGEWASEGRGFTQSQRTPMPRGVASGPRGIWGTRPGGGRGEQNSQREEKGGVQGRRGRGRIGHWEWRRYSPGSLCTRPADRPFGLRRGNAVTPAIETRLVHNRTPSVSIMGGGRIFSKGKFP